MKITVLKAYKIKDHNVKDSYISYCDVEFTKSIGLFYKETKVLTLRYWIGTGWKCIETGRVANRDLEFQILHYIHEKGYDEVL